MKFEVSKLGNRVSIKTLKKPYSRVTYLTIEDAKKTIKNINKNPNWEIIYKKEIIGII